MLVGLCVTENSNLNMSNNPNSSAIQETLGEFEVSSESWGNWGYDGTHFRGDIEVWHIMCDIWLVTPITNLYISAIYKPFGEIRYLLNCWGIRDMKEHISHAPFKHGMFILTCDMAHISQTLISQPYVVFWVEFRSLQNYRVNSDMV